MSTCDSTYRASDGQLVTCLRAVGHEGEHFSLDGEVWLDGVPQQALKPGAIAPQLTESSPGPA